MDIILPHIFRLTLLIITVVAGVSWWLAPVPRPASRAQTETQEWTLPTLTRENPKRSVALITSANLWGTVDAATQAPLNAPEWRFAGVTVNGSEKLVLVSVENQPPQLLRVGDLLPGGATIVRIGGDHLCVSIKGKKRKLDLFQ
jgi:Type II secretion system protein C